MCDFKPLNKQNLLNEYSHLLKLDTNKILVIGDIMLDVYCFGSCNRISPEAPVPILEFTHEENMLGGAGNVIKNLVSYGANCEVISVVGNDISGNIILEKLQQLKVNSKFLIVDKTRKTTKKTRIISSGQQLFRIDNEDKHSISVEIEEIIINYVRDNISKYDIIIFSDYLKGVLTYKICSEIINLSKRNNVLTLVDPKGADYKKYKNIDLIKPNLKETELLINKKLHSNKDILDACKVLKEKLNCKYVVITLSDQGIAFFDEIFDIIPTEKTQVFDVSGAGDTVLATLAICLKQNYSLFDSCYFSNQAASIVIKKIGSSTTTISEVINKIKNDTRRN